MHVDTMEKENGDRKRERERKRAMCNVRYSIAEYCVGITAHILHDSLSTANIIYLRHLRTDLLVGEMRVRRQKMCVASIMWKESSCLLPFCEFRIYGGTDHIRCCSIVYFRICRDADLSNGSWHG